MNVEIEYCVPCGLLDKAVEVEKTLLSEYGHKLNGVRLQTGDGGVFKVRVEGEEVYDAQETGYDLDAITRTVAERLPAAG